ncbi:MULTISPECIES: hypothetical protein [Moraxella]|uniref:Uncharacterized protein n=2 Tax=Moraxella TaxID=475 RepID=A0AAQ2Q223_MORBO|nr:MULTISPECIES: hypothetical protein [Moraxella]AWY19467.1 hypothetical protein DQF64_02360 [Moraxella bovis]AWY19540.1 hypothetical protein DQF64_02800 [Moraxella bovis]UYZ76181.1 hypothetical protein LP093_02315 [Moraxella bovis]UYZ77865.1 hypothetical protein LP115_11480 [Moraxella bovis]UYZ86351.1 hypothetical protein LP094_11530 [Moraxella bovis]
MNNPTLNREIKMAELERIKLETEKMRVEAEKLRAETYKIQKETRYYPAIGIVIAVIALIAAIASPIITYLLTK